MSRALLLVLLLAGSSPREELLGGIRLGHVIMSWLLKYAKRYGTACSE